MKPAKKKPVRKADFTTSIRKEEAQPLHEIAWSLAEDLKSLTAELTLLVKALKKKGL